MYCLPRVGLLLFYHQSQSLSPTCFSNQWWFICLTQRFPETNLFYAQMWTFGRHAHDGWSSRLWTHKIMVWTFWRAIISCDNEVDKLNLDEMETMTISFLGKKNEREIKKEKWENYRNKKWCDLPNLIKLTN